MPENERPTEQTLLKAVAYGDLTPEDAAKLLLPSWITPGTARDKMAHHSVKIFSGFHLAFRANKSIDHNFLLHCSKKLKRLYDRE
jgi:hypothetical protein